MLEGTFISQQQSSSRTTLHRLASLMAVECRQIARSQLETELAVAERQIGDAKAQQETLEERLAKANQRIGYLEALLNEVYTKPITSNATNVGGAFTTLIGNSPSDEGSEETTHFVMARWTPLINELGSTVILPNSLWNISMIDSVIQMCLNNVLQYKAQIEAQNNTIQYLLANPLIYGNNHDFENSSS